MQLNGWWQRKRFAGQRRTAARMKDVSVHSRTVSWNSSLMFRMVLVVVLTPLIALGLLAVVVLVVPERWLPRLALALGFGLFITIIADHRREYSPGTVLSDFHDRELFAVLDRLCALADISRPQVVLRYEQQPNTWVVHRLRQQPRLYVTTGLRSILTLDELQAVIGHELSHIANRDALVMSIVGMPGAIMLRASAGGLNAMLAVVIGIVSLIGTAILSRYREFAADAGSAEITGRPSALASALLKASNSLLQVPTQDLRKAAALNAFNLVPVSAPRRWWQPHISLLARVFATHPPLQARLDALQRLEGVAHTRHSSPR